MVDHDELAYADIHTSDEVSIDCGDMVAVMYRRTSINERTAVGTVVNDNPPAYWLSWDVNDDNRNSVAIVVIVNGRKFYDAVDAPRLGLRFAANFHGL